MRDVATLSPTDYKSKLIIIKFRINILRLNEIFVRKRHQYNPEKPKQAGTEYLLD